MSNREQAKKKKTNPVLWFLFAIVIPLLIVGIIILVILGFAGFNVADWAREQGSNIPVVSNFVSSPEETNTSEEIERLKENLNMKDEELEELDLYVVDLEETITELEQELSKQEQIVERYESDDPDEEDGEERESDQTQDDSLKDIAQSFEEMKPANAATILGGMDDQEILQLLRELPNDVRGNILQAMEIELAARITTQLMDD